MIWAQPDSRLLVSSPSDTPCSVASGHRPLSPHVWGCCWRLDLRPETNASNSLSTPLELTDHSVSSGEEREPHPVIWFIFPLGSHFTLFFFFFLQSGLGLVFLMCFHEPPPAAPQPCSTLPGLSLSSPPEPFLFIIPLNTLVTYIFSFFNINHPFK